jgi:hypothetical protein
MILKIKGEKDGEVVNADVEKKASELLQYPT